jgi:hypothetical protein
LHALEKEVKLPAWEEHDTGAGRISASIYRTSAGQIATSIYWTSAGQIATSIYWTSAGQIATSSAEQEDQSTPEMVANSAVNDFDALRDACNMVGDARDNDSLESACAILAQLPREWKARFSSLQEEVENAQWGEKDWVKMVTGIERGPSGRCRCKSDKCVISTLSHFKPAMILQDGVSPTRYQMRGRSDPGSQR